MKLEVNKLIVKYNGITVGYLKQTGICETAFQYDEEWIQNGFSISPFSLPLSSKVYICEKLEFDGLFAVFYESLPDGWGKHVISLELAKENIDYHKLSALSKLSLVPSNGLGGLTYHPTFSKNKTYKTNDFDKIQKKINLILNNKTKGQNIDDVVNLASASGGSRPKIHVELKDGSYIVKYRGNFDPENISIIELEANSLAKECGINVNDFCKIKSNICEGYFAAKRFDVDGKKRLHVISLAGILEQPLKYHNLDYGNLMQVIKTISVNPKIDLLEAYKRMCFNVLFGNKDDHSKNFAFIYDEKIKGYKLSPAFDITPTPNKLEHEMTVGSKGRPTFDDLINFAKYFEISKPEATKIANDINKKIQQYRTKRCK